MLKITKYQEYLPILKIKCYKYLPVQKNLHPIPLLDLLQVVTTFVEKNHQNHNVTNANPAPLVNAGVNGLTNDAVKQPLVPPFNPLLNLLTVLHDNPPLNPPLVPQENPPLNPLTVLHDNPLLDPQKVHPLHQLINHLHLVGYSVEEREQHKVVKL